jgi:hypothetical protein
VSADIYRAVYDALNGCDPEETPAVLWMQALHEQSRRLVGDTGEHVDIGARAWDYLVSLEEAAAPPRVAAHRARLEEAVALASIERGERWRTEYLAAVDEVAVERARLGAKRRELARTVAQQWLAVGGVA